MKFPHSRFAALFACLVVVQASAADSQKLLRIIVPYAAGGVLDSLARALSTPLQAMTGQTVIVDNRPGGSSLIGMQDCADALPDGNTYCMTVPDSLSYNPQLFKKLPYNPSAFVPVMNLGWTNGLIVVSTKSELASYKELIKRSEAQPDRFNWATWGDASMPDVYLRWVEHQTGARIVSIPYKGAALANQAVLSGEVDVSYMGIGVASPLIEAGRIKPIALTGRTRSSLFPGLPTLAELGVDAGLPGYIAIFAPPKTPGAIVDRFHAQLAQALQTPELKKLYVQFTLDPVNESPAQFAEFVKSDRERASKVFKALGFAPTAASP